MSYPFNFEDYIMENIAVYDALKREGFAESVIDRVERAVNSHGALLEAAKDARSALAHFNTPHFTEDVKPEIDKLNKAIAQAEGGK